MQWCWTCTENRWGQHVELDLAGLHCRLELKKERKGICFGCLLSVRRIRVKELFPVSQEICIFLSWKSEQEIFLLFIMFPCFLFMMVLIILCFCVSRKKERKNQGAVNWTLKLTKYIYYQFIIREFPEINTLLHSFFFSLSFPTFTFTINFIPLLVYPSSSPLTHNVAVNELEINDVAWLWPTRFVPHGQTIK